MTNFIKQKSDPVKESTPVKAVGAYSSARWAGPWLFISGQIPLDSKTGQLVIKGIKAQTKKVMENIQAILDSYKMNFNDIVKTEVFLKKAEAFSAMNEVYASYFCQPFPARSCVIVKDLPKGADIEISAIAYLEKKSGS